MKARFLFTLTKMFFCHFSDRLFVIGGGGYEGKGCRFLFGWRRTGIYWRYKPEQVWQVTDDDVSDYKMSLEAGVEYLIADICDDDCKDLDLLLFDNGNNLIKGDVDSFVHLPSRSVLMPFFIAIPERNL